MKTPLLNSVRSKWKSIGDLGIHSALKLREIRVTRIVNYFSFTLLLVAVLCFIYQAIKHTVISGQVRPESYLMLLSFLPFGLIMILNIYRQYQIARVLFILIYLISTPLWLSNANAQLGNIHYSFLLMPIPIVIFFRKISIQISMVMLTFLAFIASVYIIKENPPASNAYLNQNFPYMVFALFLGLSYLMLRYFTNEIKRSEINLKKKNAELEEFTYVASHDLKEPLRTIESFSKLIKQTEDLPANAKNYLRFIESGSKRMNSLLEDLSNYAQLNSSNLVYRMIDLNAILQTVKENLNHAITKSNGKILSDKLPVIKAHEGHMIQLFQNMINNGLKFQSKEATKNAEIRIYYNEEDDFHSIQFCDNGIGINENDFDRIFNKFQRLHNRSDYEGTGLGLATCLRIAEEYEGGITIDSKINEGSCFKVRLHKYPNEHF